jgi:hypothetical protein
MVDYRNAWREMHKSNLVRATLSEGEALTLKFCCTSWTQQIPPMATCAAETSKFPERIASHFVGPIKNRSAKHHDQDI